jgi:hypothetical protein
MLIGELPELPTVSVLKGPTFQSVLLCRFVWLSGQKTRLNHSQRQMLSLFNRSQQRAISRHFVEAQKKGILLKVHHTQGADPDVYIRGEFFVGSSSDSRALLTMSRSLWGDTGLLKTFPCQTAWGHGCLSPAVILCLATLCVLDEGISKKSLRRYLSPLVHKSSFDTALRFLKEHHLVFGDDGRLMIAPDWELKIRAWLDTNPKCNERHIKGEKRRKAESEANRVRVAKGKLTSWERTQLLERPCVIKGCKNESEQQEHFPAKKFLRRHFDVITNRHLVWSICESHNGQTKGFIMRLPADAPMPPNTLIIADGVDPMRLYSATANKWITRYYAAYEENDRAAAIHSFRMVIGLGKAIALLPENAEPRTFEPNQYPIRTKGKRAYSPHDSQLSVRQPLR